MSVRSETLSLPSILLLANEIGAAGAGMSGALRKRT
jgi:hypothetical protein